MKIREQIFRKIKKEWEKRIGKGNVDEIRLRQIIGLADTDGDGKKRVVVNGKTYLVPIEDIILKGLKGNEIENYPSVKE